MLWQAIGGTFLTIFALIALVALIVPVSRSRKDEEPED
jgi:hypothetical protein